MSALKPVAVCALAGAIAGGLALYVMESRSGNNVAGVESACAAKSETARRVGAAAKGEVAAMLAADPPQSLAELSFNGPEGAPTSIAAFSGKTLLVNLWATWCAPCRQEMPALDALQKQKGGEDFEVVAINVDTGGDDKPRKFLGDIGVETLGFYREDSLRLFNEVKQRGLALGLPVTFLVDDEGCLIAHMNGPAEWASEDAGRLVEAAKAPGGS